MYRTICCELWTDPKVQSLSVPSTYLFLYLITNTHSHLSGLYYLPIPVMQLETRLGRGTEGALKGLLASQLVEYEATYQQVWVVNMFKFQGRGQKTERGVAYYFHGLHATPLIARFLAHYPQIVPYLPTDFERCPIDTPSMEDTPFPSPVPDLLVSSLSSLSSLNASESEFEQFWTHYPKKIGKKEALKAWGKAKDKPATDDIVRLIASFKSTDQWTKENGRFIPHPATWLNQGRWADIPTAKPITTLEAFLNRKDHDEPPRIR